MKPQVIRRIANAMRINSHPTEIDGILNDEVWKGAPKFGEFLQKEPDEGMTATDQERIYGNQ